MLDGVTGRSPFAEAAFSRFLTTYASTAARGSQTGMARHIAIVALLHILERDWSVDHWLEQVIERFRSASDMAYFTFAKAASTARAIVHYGTVDGVPVLSIILRLDPAEDLRVSVTDLVTKVNTGDALKRRKGRKRPRPSG